MTILADVPPPAVAPRIRLVAPRGAARFAALARRAGLVVAPGPESGTDLVTVAVAATAEEAVRCTAGSARRLVVVCDTVTPAGLRLAVRSGAVTVLRSADLTAHTLAAAVHGSRHGERLIPYSALTQLLAADAPRPGGTGPLTPGTQPHTAPPRQPAATLTTRQTAVLRLMSEGHGNAVIAGALACSEHTVKNVIYELMARLGARNRAHAVACALRGGLI